MNRIEDTYSPEEDMNRRIDAQIIVRKVEVPRTARMMELFAMDFSKVEIADMFGISSTRVGQILNKEFDRIKQRKRKK